MARPAADRRPPTDKMGLEARAELLRGIMGDLNVAAAKFVPRAKIEGTARRWLVGGQLWADEERADGAIGDAFTLALDVALFTPSASGATAIDRFARQYRPADDDQQAALDALRRCSFRILRIGSPHPQGGHQLVDLATGDCFRLIDRHVPTGCEGLAIAARIAAIDGDAVVTTGPVTPLDDETLAIAQARMRPNGHGFRSRGGRRNRYVLQDAYEAGDRFEYRPGIAGELMSEG